MKSIIIGVIAIIVVGVIVLSVKSINDTGSVQNQPVTVGKPSVSVIPTVNAPSSAQTVIKTVEIEAGSYYYKPNIITVKKGEKVKIVIRSVSMMHNFNIDELGVAMPIVNNGDTGTIEFTADKVGTFEYYCSVGQHRKLGQVGKLIVE